MITTVTFGKPITTANENPNSRYLRYYKEWKDKNILEINVNGFSENDSIPSDLLNFVLPSGEKLVDVVENIAFTEFVPSNFIYQGLASFKPKHLLYLCGWDEHCDLTPLDNLETTWPLETITIMGSCGEILSTKYLQQITSLNLDYCCGTQFNFNGKCSLKNLIIRENDVMVQFLLLLPDIKDTIESLQIIGYNGCDDSDYIEEVVEGLSQCKKLTYLDFGHSEFIENFPTHLPPKITSLYFNGPPVAKKDFNLWLNCASNIQWLPKLTTFHYSLNANIDNDVDITVSTSDQPEVYLEVIFITKSLVPKDLRRLIIQNMIIVNRVRRLIFFGQGFL